MDSDIFGEYDDGAEETSLDTPAQVETPQREYHFPEKVLRQGAKAAHEAGFTGEWSVPGEADMSVEEHAAFLDAMRPYWRELSEQEREAKKVEQDQQSIAEQRRSQHKQETQERRDRLAQIRTDLAALKADTSLNRRERETKAAPLLFEATELEPKVQQDEQIAQFVHLSTEQLAADITALDLKSEDLLEEMETVKTEAIKKRLVNRERDTRIEKSLLEGELTRRRLHAQMEQWYVDRDAKRNQDEQVKATAAAADKAAKEAERAAQEAANAARARNLPSVPRNPYLVPLNRSS